MDVAILGVSDRPATFYVAREFQSLGIDITVILDTTRSLPRDHAIWAERTGCHLPARSLGSLGIEVIEVDGHNSAASVRHLSGANLAVNGATRVTLKPETLNAPKHGIINVHPGALPSYRGATCVEWAIFNDDAVCNTVHIMTDGIDEGAVCGQEAYSFCKSDSYIDIRVAVLTSGYRLLAATAKAISDGVIDLKDAAPQGLGTFYKPIPAEKMAIVRAKIAAGTYRYQRAAVQTVI